MGRPFVCFEPSEDPASPLRHTLPSAAELLSDEAYDAYLGCIPSWAVELHETRVRACEAADALWEECGFLEEDEDEEEQNGDVYRFRMLSPEGGTLSVSPWFGRRKDGVAAAVLASVVAAVADRGSSSCFTACLEALYKAS